MDIYAAIYYCPHCNGRTILETPYDQWGAEVTCPVCLNPFQAPRDDVLHETLGDAREGTTMCFRCPSCETTPRCDTLRKGQPITGTTVVCLVCQQMIVIPSHGEAVARAYRPR
jgi:transcription elongation factor Elf1